MPALSPKELSRRIGSEDPLLFDLRPALAHAAGTLPGARLLRLEEISDIVQVLGRTVDRHRPLVLVCEWGHRSAIACIALRRAGFRAVAYLEGGVEAWTAEGLPLTSPSSPDSEPDRRAAAAGL